MGLAVSKWSGEEGRHRKQVILQSPGLPEPLTSSRALEWDGGGADQNRHTYIFQV